MFTQDTSPTHFYIILDGMNFVDKHPFGVYCSQRLMFAGIVGFHRHDSHSEVESMNMKLAK